MRTTLKDLREMIQGLNERYELNDDTTVKFVMGRAYGGHRVELRYKKSGGCHDITYGYISKPRLRQAIYNLDFNRLDYLVNKCMNDEY